MINWKAVGVGAVVAIGLFIFTNVILPFLMFNFFMPAPASLSDLLSLPILLLGVFALFGAPLLAGFVSGRYVAKQKGSLSEGLISGAAALAIATVLLGGFQVGTMLIQSDSAWVAQQTQSILLGGESIYGAMTLSEYKSFVLFYESPLDIGITAALYVIIAVVGALVGWKLSGGKSDEGTPMAGKSAAPRRLRVREAG